MTAIFTDEADVLAVEVLEVPYHTFTIPHPNTPTTFLLSEVEGYIVKNKSGCEVMLRSGRSLTINGHQTVEAFLGQLGW